MAGRGRAWKNWGVEEENIIGQLLFEENGIPENKEIVYEMCMKRDSQRKNLLNAAD